MLFFGKGKQEAWTGVVVKKGQGTNYDEDGGKTIYYVLKVKRDDSGKTKSFVVGRSHVSLDLFNSVNESDKVAKPAGQKAIQKA